MDKFVFDEIKVSIGELGTVVTGNTPSKSNYNYWNSKDICFVKPDEIGDTGITYVSGTNEYISENAREKARVVHKNTIFVTCIGSIGKIGIAEKGDLAFNQQINAIIPNDKVMPKYLAYNLLHNKAKLLAIANSAVVPIINKKQFSDFELNIAESKEVQNKIINRLDLIEKIIEDRKQQLNELDTLIKARFIEMFGTYPDNPMGWDTGIIKDIVTDVRYGSSRPAVDGGKYPYLRMNNITYDGELDLSDIKYIDIPDNELDKCSVRRGDVLFNRTNSRELVGKTCVYNRDERMVLAGFVIRVRVNGRILPEFLSAFLNTDFSKQMLIGMCKAAIGQANINAQELQSIGIYLPPVDLQRQFVQFKARSDKSKLAIQKSLNELQTLFDSLMQEYFE